MLFFDMLGGWFRGLMRPQLSLPSPQPAKASSLVDPRAWGGAGSHGAKWPGGLANSGRSPILSHAFLRQNARQVYHTSLQARAVVERHTDTVVDAGLKLSATPDADMLGIPPEQAEAWGLDVDSRFDHWAQNRKVTLAENSNFYQMQRLAGISQQRDGEYFVRFKYSARKDLLNPMQMQFLDPTQINGSGVTSTYGGNDLMQDGIERDENGKEIAYHVSIRQKDLSAKAIKIPAVGSRSKRVMMIHGYMAEYAGQGRGYPRLSHALQEFENITDYSSAEVKKAIAQSCINMYVKPSKDNVASNPLEAISQDMPVGPAAMSAQGVALAEASNVDPADIVNYIPMQEATIAVPGSVGVFNLNEGEDLQPFKSTSPAESFPEFVNTLAGHLSASISIPLELVLMKFGQNFSASRAALVLFWRVAQIWRDEMASDFLNVVYENWLAGEIGAGRVVAPGWTDPRMRAAWLKNSWIGVPMPNIDPQKTSKAIKDHVELGITDLDREAQNLNGSSGKANRAKLARQLAELPAVPWGKANGGAGDGDGDGGARGAPGDDDGDDGNQGGNQ